MTNKPHPDQQYIEALLSNDTAMLKEIYSRFAPKVINFIKNNSGDEMQAKDVVQEVLMVIYDQARTKDLRLTCPFDAYFFLLCKRKWFNELKKRKSKEVTINEAVTSIDDESKRMADETFAFGEKQALFDQMFKMLGSKCQELLKLSFTIKSMEEVAKQLQVTYGYVRKKKSLCIGQLTKLIQSSNQYQEMKGLL